MKVAFLTMGKDIGGAKQDVLTLSQKIAAHGHDVFVIAAPGVMDRELTGTPVQFIPAEFYVRRPWGLWKASRYLLRVVRENNIELVNPQGFFTAIIAWLMRFSLHRPHIPIVTTISTNTPDYSIFSRMKLSPNPIVKGSGSKAEGQNEIGSK